VQSLASSCDYQEADVVVKMSGFAGVRWHLVDVDVERQQFAVLRCELKVLHPRLFASFTQRDAVDERFAIGVTAELQPTIELAVVGQQCATPVGG